MERQRPVLPDEKDLLLYGASRALFSDHSSGKKVKKTGYFFRRSFFALKARLLWLCNYSR
jgi:hypothetical protein